MFHPILLHEILQRVQLVKLFLCLEKGQICFLLLIEWIVSSDSIQRRLDSREIGPADVNCQCIFEKLK